MFPNYPVVENQMGEKPRILMHFVSLSVYSEQSARFLSREISERDDDAVSSPMRIHTQFMQNHSSRYSVSFYFPLFGHIFFFFITI